MSKTTKVTLSAGGESERQVKITDLEIPDIYNIAEVIGKRGVLKSGPKAKELILSVWYTAHDLKKHIIAN